MKTNMLVTGGVALLLSGCSGAPVAPSYVYSAFNPAPQYIPTQPNPIQPVAYTPKPSTQPNTQPKPPVIANKPKPQVSTQDIAWAARKIFINETGGKQDKLISWNENENFVSLGIGHFIWYPRQEKSRFTETFPSLLTYIKSHGKPLPKWLENRPMQGAPWPDKTAFLSAQNDPQVHELRRFLLDTMPLQANFMVERLNRALPTMLSHAPAEQRDKIRKNYQAMIQSPRGIYPLLDYINFKGEGVNPAERYRGQGWGLAQVLWQMDASQPGAVALNNFAQAADDVLVQRVANSPENNREARWLHGWLKRVGTYRPQALLAAR